MNERKQWDVEMISYGRLLTTKNLPANTCESASACILGWQVEGERNAELIQPIAVKAPNASRSVNIQFKGVVRFRLILITSYTKEVRFFIVADSLQITTTFCWRFCVLRV